MNLPRPSGSLSRDRLEQIAREAFERCHPDDSFDDLKRRSAFSKEDRFLLRDWLAYARSVAEQ